MRGKVAIVGMGVRFPGARTVDEFWRLVEGGIDAGREVPPDRWPVPKESVLSATIGATDKVPAARGYFVDAEAPELSTLPGVTDGTLDETWLRTLDTSVHLALLAGRDAIADARGPINRQRTAVVMGQIALPTERSSRLTTAILGATFADRALALPVALPPLEPADHRVTSLPAALLAASQGFGGGSYTLDAACASTLYALKLAADALVEGRADAVIAGGLSRPDPFYTQMGFAQLRALSPTGRSYPFDERAAGLVVGEGVGLFVLKRLADAEADGDRIYGVLCGFGLSNDRDSSLMAPSTEGQLRAMRAAYADADWRPQDVDVIECHATGTPVGDRVEVTSLRELWQTGERARCVIGSVKANVGHLLTAAGAASLAKVLLAMRAGTLPPTANFVAPAAGLMLADSPFRVLSAAEPWERRDANTPRRAAISGFGFGGINAHVLVEEWVSPERRYEEPAFPLSSRAPSEGSAFTPFAKREVAIVGLATHTAPETADPAWWGAPATAWFRELLSSDRLDAAPAMELELSPRAFRIPPLELRDMLPQQLLMLKVAADAMHGVQVDDGKLVDAGVFIGLGLDAATNLYNGRWTLATTLRRIADEHALDLSDAEITAWADASRDAYGSPLTANRVMGALAGVIASRVAREHGFAGQAFTVSNEDVSGLRALALAVAAIQRGELHTALVGAVDTAGSLVSALTERLWRERHGGQVNVRFTDAAVALVLKEAETARRDGDRILAIIDDVVADPGKGFGKPQATQPILEAKAYYGAATGLLDVARAVEQSSTHVAWRAADGNTISISLRAGNGGTAGHPEAQASHVLFAQSRMTAGPTITLTTGSRSFGVVPPPPPPARRTSVAPPLQDDFWREVVRQFTATQLATAAAHSAHMRATQEAVEGGCRLLLAMSDVAAEPGYGVYEPSHDGTLMARPALNPEPAWLDYAQCHEYAVGSIGSVLGPEFAAADAFPTRVRLPAGPLLLCHRIMRVDAVPKSMSSGTLVTEHDVLDDAWYLEDGRIPTCIAIEAGQADLFLSGYLGADFHTRGLATYRLLDAVVTFHDRLPTPGDVIRYVITIHHFFRQGETLLFRFGFEATVEGRPLMTMEHGCAGFFSAQELAAGKGLVATALDGRARRGRVTGGFTRLVPMMVESYDDTRLDALRRGDYAGCFGPAFSVLELHDPKPLPGGAFQTMLRLVHRIRTLEPDGGSFGLGRIVGEADIHPDDWFLTCHFVDDMVMPGTLMYECCVHTLRVFLMRMGWVGERDALPCEPKPGVASRLKCRGQVLPSTRTVRYEIDVKEIGYDPDAYALADARMYADDKPIVEIHDMAIRHLGLTRERVERLWTLSSRRAMPVYDRAHILALAEGKPSDAFGPGYARFDAPGQRVARLPRPPYSLVDRIITASTPLFEMRSGGEVVAEYDAPPDAWYFGTYGTNRQMPLAVLSELALQPCGWYSAYMGAALTTADDLYYRNLGGTATLRRQVGPRVGTLRTHVKCTGVSQSAGMIIHNFSFAVTGADGSPIYDGTTVFGFFTRDALAKQVGLRQVATELLPDAARGGAALRRYPDKPHLPHVPILMIDEVVFERREGDVGHGRLRGRKWIDPEEWFFAAHFLQDPVMPGSLGLEACQQLLMFAADELWPDQAARGLVAPVPAQQHEWTYRGQVLPTNRVVDVVVEITELDETRRMLTGRGVLSVDGLAIYDVKGFTITAD